MSILSKIAKFAKCVDDRLNNGRGLCWVVNRKIEEYGEVLDIKLDNKDKTIKVKVLLKGESEVIEVAVDEYEIVRNDAETLIRVASASSDRPWLDAALRNFVVDRNFRVPEKTVGYLEDFLE